MDGRTPSGTGKHVTSGGVPVVSFLLCAVPSVNQERPEGTQQRHCHACSGHYRVQEIARQALAIINDIHIEHQRDCALSAIQ
ncbi:unnamed protein product [Urochloa humidicola]